MTRSLPQNPSPPARAGERDTQADGRDGRIVGDDDDNVLESMGKAIVAPLEGAEEEADDRADPPFANLTRTLPQGEQATDDPTIRREGRTL